MSIDKNTQAARVFHRLVRDFALRVRPWDEALYHDVRPDERFDLFLASRRIYGRNDEALTVMAAAGLDSIDAPLEQKRLTLPTDKQLRRLKQRAGFESQARYRRKDGTPTWER